MNGVVLGPVHDRYRRLVVAMNAQIKRSDCRFRPEDDPILRDGASGRCEPQDRITMDASTVLKQLCLVFRCWISSFPTERTAIRTQFRKSYLCLSLADG